MNKKEEKKLQNEILIYLGTRKDCLAYRSASLKIEDKNGIWHQPLPKGHPDVICLVDGGRVIYIEVKSHDGRQSIEQRVFQKRVEELNGVYLMPRSFSQFMNEFGRHVNNE